VIVRRLYRGIGYVVAAVSAATVAFASSASATAWKAVVVNDSSFSNSASTIDTGTNAAGAQVSVGYLPLGVAITPDARTAYVVNLGQTANTGSLTPVDLTTSPVTAEPPISLSGHVPNFIAIAPDGKTAYVSDPQNGYVVPIDLTQAPAAVGTPINVGGDPEGIAFTPDGSTALVAIPNNHAVVPITVGTGSVGTAISLPAGDNPFQIAVTPDGSKAYATDSNTTKVTPISLPGGTVGSDVTVGSGPVGIAITPDGSTAYVANDGGGVGDTVTPISLATNTPGTAIPVGTGPYAVAVTPDGRTVYVTSGSGSTVVPINRADNSAGTPINVGDDPRGIAITPDRAPVANFTVAGAPPGQGTSFDGSPSTIAFGSIGSYKWSFGDGSPPQTTTTPTTSHVYSAVGAYTATLTEASSIGTSTSGEIFTGQTASAVGNPSATTSRSVVVSPAAPQVTLSTTSLSYGNVGVGQTSSAQTITMTDTGNAPLSIASSALGGAQASEFHKGTDGCTGQTIQAGGSCSAQITFAPTAGGTANAEIAFTDNASGSPHTIFLSGFGQATATVEGTVRDGALPGSPPLAGAATWACRRPSGGCHATVYTDSAGHYVLSGLTAGTYDVETWPPVSGLFPGATVVAAPNGITTQDFTLTAAQSLPSSIVVNGQSGGTPTTYDYTPTDVQVPLQVPSGGTPGTFAVTTIVFSEVPAGSSSPDGVASGSMNVLYAYDKNGVPRFVATDDNQSFAPRATGGGPAGVLDPRLRPEQTGLYPVALPTLGSWSTGLTSSESPPVLGSTDVTGATVQGVLNPIATPGSAFHGATSLRVTQTTRMFTLKTAGSQTSPPKGLPVAPPAPGGSPADEDVPVDPPVVIPDYTIIPPTFDPGVDQIIQQAEAYGNSEFGQPNGPNPGQTPPGFDPSASPNYDICAPTTQDPGTGVIQLDNGYIWDANRNLLFDPNGSVISIQSDSTVIWSGDDQSSGIHSVDLRTGTVVYSNGSTSATGSSYTTPDGLIGNPYTQTYIDPTNGNTILADQNGNPQYAIDPNTHNIADYGTQTIYSPNGGTTPFSGSPSAGFLRQRIALKGPVARAAQSGEDCNQNNSGNNYSDPSGIVRTASGIPVAGATVVLFRSANRRGRLKTVPRGSRIMSPGNRRNPDHTSGLGIFGWDVLTGFYRVTAQHPGCTGPGGRRAAQTPVLTVPPPVVDLRLVLRCPSLRRGASRISLRARREPLNQLTLVARVIARRGSRRRPQGVVTFKSGRRTLATVLLSARNGYATATISFGGRVPRVVAYYGGDGYFAPSRSRSV
jgi:YVTN family beta-propeller protein